MKRYIKSSFDPSIPDWLKTDAGKHALNSLVDQYAMSEAKFYKEPQPDSIPIYLLDDTYAESSGYGGRGKYKTPAGQYVYVPSAMGGYGRYIDTGKNYRSVGNLGKSKLAEHTVDTIYMVAPSRKSAQEDRGYVDPRYDRRWDSKNRNYDWEYMGQYSIPETEWNPETRRREDTGRKEWLTNDGGYGENKRDKSGYVIPSPEQLYKRLYDRFPERTKGRVTEAQAVLDEYYDKVNEAKSFLFNQYDIRKGKSPSMYGGKALNWLDDAISYYCRMYSGFERCMNDDGSINSSSLANFINDTSNFYGIPYCTKKIDEDLDRINKKYAT